MLNRVIIYARHVEPCLPGSKCQPEGTSAVRVCPPEKDPRGKREREREGGGEIKEWMYRLERLTAKCQRQRGTLVR